MTDAEESGALVQMFQRQMEHCNVEQGETIGLVTDIQSRRDFVGASFAAAESLGADVFEVRIPRFGRNEVGREVTDGQGGSLRLPRGPVEALKNVDMAFDFTLEGFIHVPERDEILDEETRILRAGAQPPHVLRRMMPWTAEEAEVFKERAERSADRLADAEEMHITSEYGTDLTLNVEPGTVQASYGYVDEPGQWDVWGQNMVTNYGSNHTGTIVIAPGDYNVVPFNDYIQSDVICTVEDGYIVDIDGDGIDAELMDGHMRSFDDPDVFAASHFGWGLNENGAFYNMAIHDRKPDVTGVSGDEGRVWAGNMLWSTGPDRYKERYTACHYDIAQKNCNVYLDGEPVVEEGEVVYE